MFAHARGGSEARSYILHFLSLDTEAFESSFLLLICVMNTWHSRSACEGAELVVKSAAREDACIQFR